MLLDGVPAVPFATPPASTSVAVAVPAVTVGASLAPVTLTVKVCGSTLVFAPSDTVTVKVSETDAPAANASMAVSFLTYSYAPLAVVTLRVPYVPAFSTLPASVPVPAVSPLIP